MWTPITGKLFDIAQLRTHINGLNFVWKPSLIVWHNTALPTIAQWEQTAEQDRKAGRPPGTTRINNLVSYFRDNQGWSAGPHAFVSPDGIWAFTPFNQKGVHSPSWNGTSIGIEMVGDFSKEDDESGSGARIKSNTIALTAILCERLGLNPESCIRLHKEDPRTTHDCPGINIARDKAKMVSSVLEYMGEGGSHEDKPTPQRHGTTSTPGDTLNLREKSSASSRTLTRLKNHTEVTILNEAMNGSTRWLYVSAANMKGWVAARYVKEKQ